MTLGAIPAAGGVNPSASGAANTPHNARGTLRGHPNGTDAPTQPRTSGRNENVSTSAKPFTSSEEPPKPRPGRRTTPRGRGKERRAPGPIHPRQSVGGTTDRSPSPHDSPTSRGRGKGRRAPVSTHARQPVGTTDRSPSPHDSPTPSSVAGKRLFIG